MKSTITNLLIIINLFIFSSLTAGDDEELNDLAFYGFHKVTQIHIEFDPYEGDYIDEYWFLLDNHMVLNFEWYLYQSNDLNIKIGDLVKIVYGKNNGAKNNPNYEMILYLYSRDFHPIAIINGFARENMTLFQAVSVHKIPHENWQGSLLSTKANRIWTQ